MEELVWWFSRRQRSLDSGLPELVQDPTCVAYHQDTHPALDPKKKCLEIGPSCQHRSCPEHHGTQQNCSIPSPLTSGFLHGSGLDVFLGCNEKMYLELVHCRGLGFRGKGHLQCCIGLQQMIGGSHRSCTVLRCAKLYTLSGGSDAGQAGQEERRGLAPGAVSLAKATVTATLALAVRRRPQHFSSQRLGP